MMIVFHEGSVEFSTEKKKKKIHSLSPAGVQVKQIEDFSHASCCVCWCGAVVISPLRTSDSNCEWEKWKYFYDGKKLSREIRGRRERAEKKWKNQLNEDRPRCCAAMKSDLVQCIISSSTRELWTGEFYDAKKPDYFSSVEWKFFLFFFISPRSI